jgi:hypothetical protein
MTQESHTESTATASISASGQVGGPPESWVAYYDEVRARGTGYVTTRWYFKGTERVGEVDWPQVGRWQDDAQRFPSMEAALMRVRPFKRATRRFRVEKVTDG